jgi:hypothetical protein
MKAILIIGFAVFYLQSSLFANNQDDKNDNKDTLIVGDFIRKWSMHVDTSDQIFQSDNVNEFFYFDSVEVFDQIVEKSKLSESGISLYLSGHNYCKKKYHIDKYGCNSNVFIVNFSDDINGINDQVSDLHTGIYLFIQKDRSGNVKIHKFSTKTYDSWSIIRQRLCNAKQIQIEEKKYYVIDSLVSQQHNVRCFLLTDTLNFVTSFTRHPCGNESITGCALNSSIYLAYSDVEKMNIFYMTSISTRYYLTSDSIVNMYKFPLLVYMSDYYSKYKAFHGSWAEPDITSFQSSNNNHFLIKFTAIYEIGDICYVETINCDYNYISKKIRITNSVNRMSN